VSRSLLDPRDAERLAKIAGMFGSEHPGERAAAAQADAFVRRLGLTWYNVISKVSEPQPIVTAVRPGWRQMAHACGLKAHRLTSREAKFIRDMQMSRRPPTRSQLDWLNSLYGRIHDEAHQWAKDRE